MYNFSIVNGGQTTNRIGRLDIEKDFFLQCKVIKAKGANANERDQFTHNIAEASNSQKPIKKADLKSNTPEQLRLRERLHKYQVYYITKKGDRAPKQYAEPYQSTTLEQLGKLGLTAVLQLPGLARSNSQRMYQDEYYYSIFGQDAKAGVISVCVFFLVLTCKRPMIFSVPLDIAKQKQNNINDCLLCKRRKGEFYCEQ